jgi:Transposase DDE domain group 1
MEQSTTVPEEMQSVVSGHATLIAIGLKMQQLGLLAPIREKVHIAQKTLKRAPIEKLVDGLIAILAGARGLVEINKLVRGDRALQAAFGRAECAEQSVVQDTLDHCTVENVEQMQQAVQEIYRQQSQGYQHDFAQLLVLDIDLTGRPCGKKAALATKGYFSGRPNRRGRQVGYVVAPQYEEVVVERLFQGNMPLTTALPPLLKGVEETLLLDEERRAHVILRIDAGGGSVDAINDMLGRGYHVHCKDYCGVRAEKLAASVTEWVDDPREPGRQVGWVTLEPDLYTHPVRRIAARCRKKNGQWGVGVIVSSLSEQEVLTLTRASPDSAQNPHASLLAYVYFYDQRGGGVEIAIKQDKQGLGTLKRNKKRFEAQQMVIQLEALAHNLIIWSRTWLAAQCTRIAHWGHLRMVRDVFRMLGIVKLDHDHHIVQIVVRQTDPLAPSLSVSLAAMLAQQHVNITLGEI